MKLSNFAALFLSACLNCAPFASRVLQSSQALAATPSALILRWAVGALAVSGAHHAVSAASAVLLSATSINGTVGTRLSYQIKINDGEARSPESWEVEGQVFGGSGSTKIGMPPGLSLGLGTAIISGLPTQSGTFPVSITAYEKSRQSGASLSFTLTFVIGGGATPPVITTQPAGGTASEGSPFSFTVAAAGTGTGTLSYTWRHDGSIVAGAGAPTFTLDPVQTSDAGEYTVIVSNSGGSTTSAPATLTVLPAGGVPIITLQPADTSLHPGETLSLSVAADGGGSLGYQWRHDDVILPGQTNSTLTLSAVADTDAGKYDVVVSNLSGEVTSAAATVTLVPLTLRVLSLASGNFILTLPSIPGRSYTLQAADFAIGAPWVTLGQTTATSDSVDFVDPFLNKPQRFWRFFVQP